MLLYLPCEIIEEIFSYLEGKDVKTLLSLGLSPLFFTRLVSPSIKFIPSLVLEKLPRLREVKGYIFLHPPRRILVNCVYFLKNFSHLSISPFLEKDVTIITSSPCRCRMIERKGDFVLLYNCSLYTRYLEKEFPYIWKKDRLVTLGKKKVLPLWPLVRVCPEVEEVLHIKITSLPHLSSRLFDYLKKQGCLRGNEINLETFPFIFYEKIALLATRKRLGSYLTLSEFRLLIKFFTVTLNPFQEALLHRLENFSN